MSACPARALPPLPPLLSPFHRHDQSSIAVLMMSHSNLLDLKQNEVVMVSWGSPSLSLTLWVLGGGVGYLCLLHWRWLLCSWHLSPPQSPLLFPVFLFLSPSCCTWKVHGPLCVCARVRLYIYMYREIYMWEPGGIGRGWSAAQSLQPGHCPPELIPCSILAGEVKESR